VIGEVWEAWEGFTEVLERIEGAGETVVVLGSISGRGRASGVEVTTKAALVWTIRDGLVEAVDMFSDQDEALRSVGLAD
jgi:ketosteroid isomerase-like protein